MSFFVLDKDTSSGVLRLPIEGMYATREEALSALSGAVASGSATVVGQVYVVDLETALPVLVMPTAPAPAPVAETVAAELTDEDLESEVAGGEAVAGDEDLEEADVDVDVEPEIIDGGSDEVPDAAPEAFGIDGVVGGVSLADALKRAATSLEDEGIVAPESINADDFAPEEEFVAASAEGVHVDVQPAEVAQVAQVVAAPMSATLDEPAEVLTAPADWPWANVEAFTEEVALDDEPAEPGAAEEPSAIAEGEPVPAAVVSEPIPVIGLEDDTLITSAPPAGEEAYVPRPVILGDYADAEPAGVEPAVEVAPEVGEAERMDADAADASTEATPPAETDPFDAILEGLSPAPGEPLPEPAAEIGYEPTGDLDLGAYTCNDCVYSNTCPKVGEVTPADCGTFQWRSS